MAMSDMAFHGPAHFDLVCFSAKTFSPRFCLFAGLQHALLYHNRDDINRVHFALVRGVAACVCKTKTQNNNNNNNNYIGLEHMPLTLFGLESMSPDSGWN